MTDEYSDNLANFELHFCLNVYKDGNGSCKRTAEKMKQCYAALEDMKERSTSGYPFP